MIAFASEQTHAMQLQPKDALIRRRALAVLLSSSAMLAISAGGAAADCTVSGDALTALCDGVFNAPFDFQAGTPIVIDGESINLTVQGLPNQTITNNDTTAPAIGITTEGPANQDYIGSVYMNFNLDGDTQIPVVSNNTSVLSVSSGGVEGARGANHNGGGHQNGGNGGTGGDAYGFNPTINQLSATVIQDGSGATDVPVLHFLSAGGLGGSGGQGVSTGVGDGFGGNGGAGGLGGSVNAVLTDVSILRDPSGAYSVGGGIVIDGQGGRGGDGSLGQAADYSALGGQSGVGGDGGDVDLFARGLLKIEVETVGISINSNGGRGGNGGFGHNTLSGKAVGGNGGTGGRGGNIRVGSTFNGEVGMVDLFIIDAPGIFAQSLAGDGGDGGAGTANIATGVGGSGGAGGTGGGVDILLGDTSDLGINTITTTGGPGIIARSHGGGGGNGGDGKGFEGQGGATFGSGPGGDVSVEYTGSIHTTGRDGADAIIAQSVGGFAGSGGDASSFISYGGNSQSSGAGGKVNVTYSGAGNQGALSTTFGNSSGIYAQSVGGGGGKAGSASGVGTIAGNGAAGGDGGKVTVSSEQGDISTIGDVSRGIFAQSVGGGGGDGGTAKGVRAVGGSGAAGGAGGEVHVTNQSNINTAGLDSTGLFAQSIGGGGGFAGSATGVGALGANGGSGATGGAVTILDNSAGITTKGNMADAVFAQSVGGSGGKGSNTVAGSAAFSLAISGAGGTGNHGGDVTFSGQVQTNSLSYTDLTTTGDNARGLVVSSVGGGGGDSGNAISASGGAIDVSIGIGKDGGSGGDGGTVEATHFGKITTSGANSMGVVATSVGGSGSAGGNGGAVTVCRAYLVGYGEDCQGDGVNNVVASGLNTSGASATGIYAASIGGGGGHSGVDIDASGGFVNADVGVGGSGGAGGTGGLVQVYSGGGITTTGDAATAITATSIGGNGGASGPTGGAFVNWTGATLTTTGSQSSGIIAHSSAGSGGLGGFAASGQGVGYASGSVSIGGSGGDGGTAAASSVTSHGGAITTSGTQSVGISVMSLGGHGGMGGTSITGDLVSQGEANVTIGGGGGNGGTAFAADIIQMAGGSVTTKGSNSTGLVAKSIGGDGGHGGMAVETALNLNLSDGVPAGSATFTMGGGGGDGGTSGKVNIQNDGDVTTEDLNSYAIQAQSIGGSGGSGGMSISGTANIATQSQFNAGVTIGGKGGAGGTSADVNASNSGIVKTAGDNAIGMISQSLGGSGGIGGSSYNILANVKGGADSKISAEVAIGGSGGTGGQAGIANASNTGVISTTGTSATGIFAQSVGGNGGVGGSGGNVILNLGTKKDPSADESTDVAVNFAIGGNGGDGAIGEAAKITNTGTVTTTGATAYGVFAQSIGGNGGDGGSASNYTLGVGNGCQKKNATTTVCKDKNGNQTNVTYKLNVALGGNGNHAGDASVSTTGAVQTQGENAHAIFAQSVGGGGGTGGSTLSKPVNFQSKGTSNQLEDIAKELETTYSELQNLPNANQFSLFIGGSGGATGNGGKVTVGVNGSSQTSVIASTTGDNANAILAQSIGGAGGSGGTTNQSSSDYALRIGSTGGGGGDGGAVEVTGNTAGMITTTGTGSTAILAQSVGGGGGNAGAHFSAGEAWHMNLQIGGSDGVSGNGGDVTVDLGDQYLVRPTGYEASGIFAQSVGGGGGSHSGGGDMATGSVTVGGASTGTVQGNGGDVEVTVGGIIATGPTKDSTTTAASHGIFAQSVGGGGGYGGSVLVSDLANVRSDVLSTTSGATGNGGNVTVNSTANIFASGAGSMGIFAQSVGGGGGVQGDVLNVGTAAASVGSFGGQGTAGVVTVNTQDNQIITDGLYAHGILAQYSGGSGTTVSTTPTVDVTVGGLVEALGNTNGSVGVFATSSGDGHGGIEITVSEDGTILAETGFEIFESGTEYNSLTNNGTITSTALTDGVAVKSDGGFLDVINNGKINGSIVGVIPGLGGTLGSQGGQVSVTNTGLIEPGSRLDVVQLENTGTLHIHADGTADLTEMTGDLIQKEGGVLVLDVHTDNDESDVLTVDGDVTLAGDVKVQLIGSGDTQAGTYTVLTSTGTLDASEIQVVKSPVANVSLANTDTQTLQLSTSIDFDNSESVDQLSRNLASAARHVDETYRAGLLDDGLADDLPGSADVEDYAKELSALSLDQTVSGQIAAVNANLSFTDSLFSCPNTGATYGYFNDGQCVYFSFADERFERDTTTDLDGFTDNTLRLSLGAQYRLENDLHLGGVISYDSSDMNAANSGSSSDSRRVQVGVSLKRFVGNWEFGAGAGIGYGNYTHKREVSTGAFATGDRDMLTYGAQIRTAYMIDSGNWYAKPLLALGGVMGEFE